MAAKNIKGDKHHKTAVGSPPGPLQPKMPRKEFEKELEELRFQSRIDDPARRWKLSPMDLEARTRWVEYSKAKDLMVEHTSTAVSPWWEVAADDKRRARLNTISHLLSLVDYHEVRQPKVK